jgi:hypothetical protein
MYSHIDNVNDNQNRSVVNEEAPKQGGNDYTDFVDNSPEAKEAAQLQAMADNSPEAKEAAQLQAMADNSQEAKEAAQLQAMADNSQEAKEAAPPNKPNNTGLPDDLKSNIENLSGYSLDDVKVHYNSDKPTELQAHAYAQGTNIYLGPGQEKHLPHETWHVVQQMQERVKPTIEMQEGGNMNDDDRLEKEADNMGDKASFKKIDKLNENKNMATTNSMTQKKKLNPSVIQAVKKVTIYTKNSNNNFVDPNMDIYEEEDANLGYAHLSRSSSSGRVRKSGVSNLKNTASRITGEDYNEDLNHDIFHEANTNNHHLTLENSFCAAFKYQIKHIKDVNSDGVIDNLMHNKLNANKILQNNTDNLNCHPDGNDALQDIMSSLKNLAFQRVAELKNKTIALSTKVKRRKSENTGMWDLDIIEDKINDIGKNIGEKKSKINNIFFKTQKNIRYLSMIGFNNANQNFRINSDNVWGQDELNVDATENLKDHIKEASDENWFWTKTEIEPMIDDL